MRANEGKEIIDNIQWLKEIQESENVKKPTEPQIKAINWAEHYVRHFFGMETDDFLTDLYFEIKHLGLFAEHIAKHDKDFSNTEVQLRILDLINSLIKYHNRLAKEDVKNDKS